MAAEERSASFNTLDVSLPVEVTLLPDLCAYYGNPMYAECGHSQRRPPEEVYEEEEGEVEYCYATLPADKNEDIKGEMSNKPPAIMGRDRWPTIETGMTNAGLEDTLPVAAVKPYQV